MKVVYDTKSINIVYIYALILYSSDKYFRASVPVLGYYILCIMLILMQFSIIKVKVVIFRFLSLCTLSGRHPYEEENFIVFHSYRTRYKCKIYTQKFLMLVETAITEFHENTCIPALQKLGFILLYVRILGTHHHVKEYRKALKN